jgi:plasmid stabilization system protein ParE
VFHIVSSILPLVCCLTGFARSNHEKIVGIIAGSDGDARTRSLVLDLLVQNIQNIVDNGKHARLGHGRLLRRRFSRQGWQSNHAVGDKCGGAISTAVLGGGGNNLESHCDME